MVFHCEEALYQVYAPLPLPYGLVAIDWDVVVTIRISICLINVPKLVLMLISNLLLMKNILVLVHVTYS